VEVARVKKTYEVLKGSIESDRFLHDHHQLGPFRSRLLQHFYPMLAEGETTTFGEEIFSEPNNIDMMSFQQPILPHMAGDDSIPRISAETLHDLFGGKFDLMFKQVYVLDCRYSYEYEGGQIKGAMNVHSPREVMELFFPDVERHSILIFHCELSKNRGPTQAMKFREIDRKLNESRYPVMFYPDVYVLEGGYREYYAFFPGDCVGGYVAMQSEEEMKSGLSASETREWRLGLEDYAKWKSDPLRRCLQDRMFFWLEHQRREEEKAEGKSESAEAEAEAEANRLSDTWKADICEEADSIAFEGDLETLMRMELRTLTFGDEEADEGDEGVLKFVEEGSEEGGEEAEGEAEGEGILMFWEPNVVCRQEKLLPRLLCFEDEEEEED
jgi:hypothetical protein